MVDALVNVLMMLKASLHQIVNEESTKLCCQGTANIAKTMTMNAPPSVINHHNTTDDESNVGLQ